MFDRPLPQVIVHVAISVDGRTGSSPPVEGGFPADIGLFYELARGWKEDATLAGVETLAAATPENAADLSTAERADSGGESAAPLLVVSDSRGRMKHWEYWLGQPYWSRAVLLCSKTTPVDYLERLTELGVESIVAGDDRVDYRSALAELRDRFGVEIMRVDSGGTLIGALLRAGLVNEVSVLVHPFLSGSSPELSLFRATAEDAADARAAPISLALRGVEVPRDDIVWLRYDVTS